MLRKALVVSAMLFVFAYGYADSNLEHDFAMMNGYFISALLYTDAGEKDSALLAIEALCEEWKVFDRKYSSYMNTRGWRDIFTFIRNELSSVGERVSRNPLGFNRNLRSANTAFMELQKMSGFIFVTGELFRLERSVNDLDIFAKAKSGRRVVEADFSHFARVLSEINTVWASVLDNLDKSQVSIVSDSQMAIFKTQIEGFKESLINLEDAINARDREIILDKALAVRPAYIEMLRVFNSI
jgi:hypothetical protein